jgi:phosphohistidine phosphatase SixA
MQGVNTLSIFQNLAIHAPSRRGLLGALGLLLLMALAGWVLCPSSAPDLGDGHQRQHAGIYHQWASGNTVVFIRHAERCDRSLNPCLGDPAGITASGAQGAQSVGKALQAMGLQHTDVVSSPLVRTVQTSAAIFGHAVPAVSWLQNCRSPSLAEVLALKKPGRNLVVVTHSGCIEHYERQLDVGRTPSAGYVGAFFVSAPDNHRAKVLGYLDAPAWPTFVDQAAD